ncbi:RNA-binding S4 domain-containing protein [bacterium]|nr:RNA-binding S4 domain-containing protein [bacterium]
MDAAGGAPPRDRRWPSALGNEPGGPVTNASNPTTRVDRWLWAARAFKSRSQAAQACDGGKVMVNDAGAKPHKLIRPGDEVAFTTPGGRRIWKVLDLAERRGPASVARALYEDLTPPPPPEPVADSTLPRRDPGSGRPTKRDRRQMRKFFG